MIRTRDLVLFVVSVIFLVTAIGATVWVDTQIARRNATDPITLVPGTAPEATDEASVATLDRQAVATRLKNALATNESTIEPVPSVTTEADAAVNNPGAGQGSAAVQRCAAPDDVLGKIGLWPLSGTAVEVREGARVFYSEARVSTTGTSTTMEVVENDLLALPLIPSGGGEYCVPSEVAGVTPQGVLIFNSDVDTYADTNEHLLIGYARDGYPIYGAYEGEVDACGGYQHPAGYRYVIRPESDHIIGCFTAPPQPFMF